MEINGHNGIFVGGASGMALATAEKFKAGGGNVAILDLPTSDGAAVACLLYTSPSPRDATLSRMPSSA